MTTDKVVKLTPELAKDLKSRRILTESEQSIPVELAPVQPGEKRVGTLTAEESQIFLELFNLQDDMEQWDRELTRRSLLKAADLVIEDEAPGLPGGVFVSPEGFLNEDEARQYHEMRHRFQYLQEMLWYNLRSRLDMFHYTLGVRRGFTVVNTGPRFNDERKSD